jgi:TRAP-type C4-dicarboxylate transport system substrate-binding protein
MVRALSDKSVFESVAPNWVDRVGADSPFIQVFNEKIGTRVGLRVEPDGSVTRTEATATATTAGVPAALTAYAAEHAGGPGAIYVGDLNQLVGPSFSKDYADSDGNVPLGPLERHLYIYESDYYKSLLEKAKFTNPTQLVSEDEEFEIQYACINRAFVFCELSEVFLFPNVLERTNGQLKLVSSSYPELGIAGPDVLDLVSDGTLSMAQIIGPYVAGDVPAVEIQYLFGIFPDRETMFNASADMVPDLEKLNSEATGGGKVIYFSWSSGDDIFVSSKNPLRTPEDFDKLRVRAFGTAIADWIQGMGAESQFVAFSEVYTALERGIVEAAISGGAASFGQRWYEVADYLNGPLVSFPNTVNVVNKKVWEKLPPDLQQIFIEEGAKSELEAFRVAAIHNEVVLDQLIETGMEYVEFSPEVRALSDKAVIESVAPNWVKRVGPESPFIQVFNEKIGTRVGLRVEPDGSVVKVPVTKE